MYIEYRYKLKILQKLRVFRNYEELGHMFNIMHPKTASNSGRSYVNGEVTPTETGIETMCKYSPISYDFMSNCNLRLNPIDSLVVDLLWSGLIGSEYKVRKVDVEHPFQCDNIIIFKPNSPILKAYFNEINNEVAKDGNYTCLEICASYNDYCLDFPYTSETYKNYVAKLYEDVKTSSRDYLEREGIIQDAFMGRIPFEELKNRLSTDNTYPTYLNINARANIISKFGNCNFNSEFNLSTYGFKSTKRIAGTTLSFEQAEILERGLKTPIGLLIPLYNKFEYYPLDSIIWTDILNQSYTLTEVTPNSSGVYEDGYYVINPEVNQLLRRYFDIQNSSKSPKEYYNKLLSILEEGTGSLEDYCDMVSSNKLLSKKMYK